MKPLSTVARWFYSFVMFFALIAFNGMASGCTKDEVALNSYKVLESSKVTYYAVMQNASAMHQRGSLSDDKYGELKDAALIYVDSYLIAVSALATYAELNEADKGLNKDDKRALLEQKVDIVTKGFNEFIKKAIQLGVDAKELKTTAIADGSTVHKNLNTRASPFTDHVTKSWINLPVMGN